MYKVFIDNKPVIFTETFKKSKKDAGFRLLPPQDLTLANLLKTRRELAADIPLVIETNEPEKQLFEVFSSYEFLQAAGGLVKRKECYLFIERLGVWDLPKGKMENTEQPHQTAVREIEEECGIENPVIERLLGTTWHTYEFRGHAVLKKNWWYLLSYNGPKKLTPQSEEDITQAVWLTKEEWGKVKKNTYASIAEVLDLAKEC
jgi:ADP-ribose pyrophosphatase YjhB (NUDIX family)